MLTPQKDLPPQRRLPSTETLLEWKAEGLTNQQIVERNYELTGYRVTPTAVSVALHRAGKTGPKVRYVETLPWRVKGEHTNHYAAEMLRAEGRLRLHGPGSLSEEKRKRLEAWKQRLHERGAVIAYLPWTDEGFFEVFRDDADEADALITLRQPGVPAVA